MAVHSRKLKDFGEKVKIARERKGITQERLAELIGVTTVYVGFLEQGRRLPSIKTADKLARILSIKLSDLFD